MSAFYRMVNRVSRPVFQILWNGSRTVEGFKLAQAQRATWGLKSGCAASLLSTQAPPSSSGTIERGTQDPVSFKIKCLRFLGWMLGVYSKKSVLVISARNMYECCVEGINYEDFYKACNMPDTFQSWFLVNHLHVWMCLVRLKMEDKDGQYMYRKLVEIMWQDVQERMKALGIFDSSIMRTSLQELVQEFYGFLVAYDEGLLSHDRVLAAALWRNLIHDKQKTDATALADLVEYVRHQVMHLDRQDSGKLLQTGHVNWIPFRSGAPTENTTRNAKASDPGSTSWQ